MPNDKSSLSIAWLTLLLTLEHQNLLASLNMAPTEMTQDGIPATPPCSPDLSSPDQSRLRSQDESSSLLQSAHAPAIDDLEQLSSKLTKARLTVLAGESIAPEL
ncbi:MAG: hypothetical protein CL912_07715 [Deltaproteobacteria bacterium]|nr:hypothetical protein [Deltaproteobacteria bacterium]